MKLENIDMTKILSPDNRNVKGRRLLGESGFFVDDLEQLNDLSSCLLGTLTAGIYNLESYKIQGEIKILSYFIPLIAFKENPFSPCVCDRDFKRLFNLKRTGDLVGAKLFLRSKDDRLQIATLVINVERENNNPIKITLGNGNVYTGRELFDQFLILKGDNWIPFGIIR